MNSNVVAKGSWLTTDRYRVCIMRNANSWLLLDKSMSGKENSQDKKPPVSHQSVIPHTLCDKNKEVFEALWNTKS